MPATSIMVKRLCVSHKPSINPFTPPSRLAKIGPKKPAAITIGKAGRVRHMGKRPSVRGKAMSPRAHPHGGGEGVNPIGLKHPKTPWGKPAMGFKTRKNKYSDKFILRRKTKRR